MTVGGSTGTSKGVMYSSHALAVVWSHYPAINLQAIGVGFARGTGATKQEQLTDEVGDATKRLAREWVENSSPSPYLKKGLNS